MQSLGVMGGVVWSSAMNTVSMVMIWFQGTSTLAVTERKGSRISSSLTEPPPLTRISNLEGGHRIVVKLTMC